jgi:hypothetical protein
VVRRQGILFFGVGAELPQRAVACSARRHRFGDACCSVASLDIGQICGFSSSGANHACCDSLAAIAEDEVLSHSQLHVQLEAQAPCAENCHSRLTLRPNHK